jgi:hypothetical protein
MNEFVRSAAGGKRSHAIIVGWLAPLLLGFFTFAVFILPSIQASGPVRRLGGAVRLLGINEFLFSFIALIAAAMFLYLNRSLLYKLLEGEKWPWFIREWRRRRAHIPHWRYIRASRQHSRAVATVQQLRHDLEAAKDRGASTDEVGRLREAANRATMDEQRTLALLESAARRRLTRDRQYKYGVPWLEWMPRRRRPLLTPLDARHDSVDWIPAYPEDEVDVMATRIGNELRAMETFAYTTYGLDSQTLWYELYSVAPDALREAVDDAELQADTYVASIYTALALLVAAFVAGLWSVIRGQGAAGLWVVCLVIALLIPVLHRGLLEAINEWRATVQAMVVNGRLSLRQKYGLRAPRNHEEERTMWQALTGFVHYGGDEYYARQLDLFREDNKAIRPDS